jgi:hypothetical protein
VQVGGFKQFFADGFAAPSSNKTLSGNTTAAWPVVLRMLFMCCTKLSRLFLVVTQKS